MNTNIEDLYERSVRRRWPSLLASTSLASIPLIVRSPC